MKQLKSFVSEIYFLLSVAYYWVLTGTVINLVAISLLMIISALIILKSRLLGITLAAVVIALNLFLIMALISELSEFRSFNERAMLLLAGGLAYIGLNIFMGIRMLMRWLPENLTSINSNR